MEQINQSETIAAISTPAGTGGIAVIRVSGPEAVKLVNQAWKGTDLNKVKSHSLHLGKYYSTDGNLLDEAVASIFLAPNSFTGEDVVEISVHGSSWIQREVLNDLVRRGIRIANPGEFTQRAFLNGKIDLAQAEGIADLIASSSKAAHDLAISQTRGLFSKEFELLREKLIEFASLIELELDFSEEDVEFANRPALISLCEKILNKVNELASSYSRGSALKNGVPVVIAGIPNAGKSSLLNLLIGDDKAIVTDIPGTTRDIIEDSVEINGILYRFIDTAGIRDTDDVVEGMGVERALQALNKAEIVIWMIDSTSPFAPQLSELKKYLNISANSETNHSETLPKSDLSREHSLILLFNKCDISEKSISDEITKEKIISPILFSTKTRQGLQQLLEKLHELASSGSDPEKDILITNARHYEALTKASKALSSAIDSLKESISPDFIAQDIREAITHLSSLTGSITSDTLLHSIFSRFCIGK